MKSILMLAVLASAPAMALTIGDGRTEPSVRYLSWCDGNSVISEDAQGQLYVKAVCKQQTEECRLTERPFGQGSTISATCVLKK
ncbi:MAG: hypothetical protein JSU04_06245 [Bdellovibrionales bacterium]|nr:hypothetical protein [Bdellovibrionales bacterium]